MFRDLAISALKALPPERAHALTIRALAAGLGPTMTSPTPASLRTQALGVTFDTPLGVAAGFDKNAEAVDGLLAMGAGFVEVGAVTPRPQAGNPRPRVFRLPQERAIINRLGFNNEGMDAVAERLRARRAKPGIVGVNLGANANSVDRNADFEAVLRRLFGLADYFSVNVSSPNTKDLRALQGREALSALLSTLVAERDALAGEMMAARAPILVKIAPDLSEAELEDVAAVALATGIDGIVATNTTISRPEGLRGPHAQQGGGLSGPPVRALSTAAVRRLSARTEGRLTIIGVGGVETADDAYEKLRAGARLLQLYTGLVYQGPTIFADIASGLAERLARDGAAHISEIVGADVAATV